MKSSKSNSKNGGFNMWQADLGNGKYRNPILYADYSDPDAIRVGEDYFMIASSFCNAPGLPILHSKDLVNWKVVNYALDELPEFRYRNPIHGCGVWAPAIRYHEGTYYICFPMPDEGIYMTTTKDPFGKWSKPVNIRPGAGWIDPCPFWDDDGKAYLVAGVAKSRIGYKSVLHMVEMQPDGMGLIGEEVKIFDGNENDQVTIEGPKMYKRNGWYYVFAPAGGVKTGWQTVLRSKNPFGPYEYKVVMRQGDSPVNGPHQGAWVDTVTGQDWFLHFQDVYAGGRIVHLQPMHWENDWPIIGINKPGNDYGEPVMEYTKPDIGKSNSYPVCEPDTSDDFTSDKLGMQWQWNANYKKEWYDLENGQLILHAQAADPKTQLCDISNLLLQKWPAPEFSITTCLHLEEMKDGDVAGLVSLGGCYTALAVQKINGKMSLQQRTGNWTKDDEVRTGLGDWNSDVIYIQMKVEKENYRTFYVGTAEENLQPVGQMVEATPGRWVGVKDGLFAINEQGMEGGLVAADYFVYQEL